MHPSIALMGTYIIVTAVLQFIGFFVSRIVEAIDPGFGLMTFLILYLGMFWLGWPVAVKIAEAVVPGVKSDPSAKA